MEMIFKIKRTTYKIVKEAHCFSLQKLYVTQKKEEEWTVLGYYKDFYFLLKRLVSDKLISSKTATSFESSLDNMLKESDTILKSLFKAP